MLINERATYKSDTKEINTLISSSLRNDIKNIANLAASKVAIVEVEDFTISFNPTAVLATVLPL